MKRLLLLFLRERESVCVCAQNFVPNNSFEQYDTCPDNTGHILYSLGWFEPCKQGGWSGADYFNECDSTQGVSVPMNVYGYQFAKTGNAYAGIVTSNGPAPPPIFKNAREFVEIKLLSPLFQNAQYCISFYISLANKQKYATDKIGCLLTVDSFLTDSFNQEIFLIPQIENTQGIITDTMNWVLISGEFTASGGEQFLTIGNFRNDSNTSVMQVQSNGSFFAYYYIDDVSVTLCDTTAVEELQIEDYRLQVYPNPASGNVTITVNGGDKIIITDITGRKIKEYKISTNQLKINTDEYDDGIYFIALYNGNRLVATRKLVIAK